MPFQYRIHARHIIKAWETSRCSSPNIAHLGCKLRERDQQHCCRLERSATQRQVERRGRGHAPDLLRCSGRGHVRRCCLLFVSGYSFEFRCCSCCYGGVVDYDCKVAVGTSAIWSPALVTDQVRDELWVVSLRAPQQSCIEFGRRARGLSSRRAPYDRNSTHTHRRLLSLSFSFAFH